MQPVIVDKPYTFIPPCYSGFWHGIVRRLLPGVLRRDHGIVAVECHGVEKLRASLDAGAGIMIAPNHCRPCDPMVLDTLARAAGRPFHIIASWHVFMLGRIQRFLLPRMGGFSMYREGMDRESLKCAAKVLTEGRHPLVVFPEGIITRANDRLGGFMEGPSFMARMAARQREDGRVMIHPVFIRYFFEGDLEGTVLPVLDEIERRLSWQPQDHLEMKERIVKAGSALLALKEMEHLGAARAGDLHPRITALQEHLLSPMETRWLAGRHDGDVVGRVKRLRSAILAELLGGDLGPDERAERWRSLADLYLVQQLHCYPGDYFEDPSPERILETIERFEEDLTDRARPHGPIRAVITVGDAIVVTAEKERAGEDTVSTGLRRRMTGLLAATRMLRKTQVEASAL